MARLFFCIRGTLIVVGHAVKCLSSIAVLQNVKREMAT
jgi:hypothetical protein